MAASTSSPSKKRSLEETPFPSSPACSSSSSSSSESFDMCSSPEKRQRSTPPYPRDEECDIDTFFDHETFTSFWADTEPEEEDDDWCVFLNKEPKEGEDDWCVLPNKESEEEEEEEEEEKEEEEEEEEEEEGVLDVGDYFNDHNAEYQKGTLELENAHLDSTNIPYLIWMLTNNKVETLQMVDILFENDVVEPIADAIKECKSIKNLFMDACFIDDQIAAVFHAALKDHPTVENLSMASNVITVKSVPSLLGLLSGNLKTVRLDGNEFHDDKDALALLDQIPAGKSAWFSEWSHLATSPVDVFYI